MDTNQRQVARAAFLVMGAFAASRVLGLVRQMVFSAYFGTGPDMAAYVTAQRLPEAIFTIAAGGALGSAFIPLFAERLANGQNERAWSLASALVNMLLLLLIPVSLLSIVLAPWLVRVVLAPALAPEVQLEAVRLMRVMLITPAIFSVSGVVMGALNAHQHFLLPALAPIFYNAALIAGAVWGGVSPIGVMGPAWGVVIGALLHLLVQVPGLLRFGARYSLRLWHGDSGVLRVLSLMAPRMLGVAALQLNLVITNNLASRYGPGVVAALDYAWRLMLLPEGVLAQAVGTAAFPTFARLAAERDWEELSRTLTSTLRTLVALTIPASVGMILLRQPIIAVMFQRGQFTATSTSEVAWALAFFAIGIAAHSGIEVLARAFYALQDTWTPALAALVSVVCNVGLGITLPLLFVSRTWAPQGGLALANALAVIVEVMVLAVVIFRRLRVLRADDMLQQAGRVSLAALLMGLVLIAWVRFGPASIWVSLVGGVSLGTAVYLAAARLLGIRELSQALQVLLHRR